MVTSWPHESTSHTCASNSLRVCMASVLPSNADKSSSSDGTTFCSQARRNCLRCSRLNALNQLRTHSACLANSKRPSTSSLAAAQIRASSHNYSIKDKVFHQKLPKLFFSPSWLFCFEACAARASPAPYLTHISSRCSTCLSPRARCRARRPCHER